VEAQLFNEGLGGLSE